MDSQSRVHHGPNLGMPAPRPGFQIDVVVPIVIWLAWIAIVAWSYWIVVRQELHPRALPLLVLLTVVFGGAMILFIRFGIALIRMRERCAALGTFCCGTLPVWLLVLHGGYVYLTSVQRWIEISPVTLMLLPTASVFGEIEANLRYTDHTEGERVVMHHNGLRDAQQSVAAADEFLAHLESLLKTPQRAKVNWIRGSILGRDGFSFGAFSMGSSNADEILSILDRHELAHFAINQHLALNSRPSMLLVEGWAEVSSVDKNDAEQLEQYAWIEREYTPSISELAGPAWASIDAGPVYTQGGPFVDQLLKDFGGEKFFELYFHSKPATFDADCQRILGVSLASLQQRFEERVGRWSDGMRLRQLLATMTVADGVDRDEWIRFIDVYAGAIDKHKISGSYDASGTNSATTTNKDKKPESVTTHFRVVRDANRSLISDGTTVLSVTENDAFYLHRSKPDQPWQIRPPLAPFSFVNRWYIGSSLFNNYSLSVDPAFDRNMTWNWRREPPELKELTLSEESGQKIIRIRLDTKPPPTVMKSFTRELTFSEQVKWRLTQDHQTRITIKGDLTEATSKYEYKFDGDELVERKSEYDSTTNAPGGETPTFVMGYQSRGEIAIRRPSTTSFDEFLPGFYGIDSSKIRKPSLVIWPITTCVVVAALQLLLGMWILRRKPPAFQYRESSKT